MIFSVKKDISNDREGWRRNLKEAPKITKGSYIVKLPKPNCDNSNICSICQNCKNKSFCENRMNTSKMLKCSQCKNCTECDNCDRFYKNEQFRVVITIGRDDKGKAIRKAFASSSEDEALFKALQYKKDIENGVISEVIKTEKSICEIGRENENKKQKSGEIKDSSYLRNICVIEKFEKTEWGNKPITKVKKEEIIKYFDNLRLCSNSTMTKEFNVLRKIYKIAMDRHYIKKNLFEGEDGIKLPKSFKEDKEICALSKDEEQLFIQYITNNHCLYRHIFLLALYTGMRIGEIVVLTIDDLDFKRRIININKSISTDINKNFIIGTTKTGNGRRKIIMNDDAYAILKDALECMYPNERNLIFCRENGDLVNRSMVNAELRRICEKMGIKKFSMHAFRHTFATRCVEAGLNFKAIQGFLGHSNITTTLDIYADFQDDFKREEMLKYERYMKEQ